MIEAVEVRSAGYADSVLLMQIAEQARGVDGVSDCIVAMATELNLSLLADLGFDADGVTGATPADMIVAIRGKDDGSVGSARTMIDSRLADTGRTQHPSSGDPSGGHRTLRSAVRASGANLAVISLPGSHASAEAADALRAGANVMIFSDGVSLTDEKRLKEMADERGLLVMGPDCGTALLAGVGLGFVNDVRRGDIGVVAASGTGAQHLMCLLDAWGCGVSHVIGVGGRDLCDQVGGTSTARAMQILDADPATTHIVVLAKQAGVRTRERIDNLAAGLVTPVSLGMGDDTSQTLTDLARQVAGAAGCATGELFSHIHERAVDQAPLAGLFSGGTLACEAFGLLTARGHRIVTLEDPNAAVTPQQLAACADHFIIDFGDDRFTAGRPHPMIDQRMRQAVIDELTAQRGPRHLLIDVVLGQGAHPDPAGALGPSLEAFLRAHPGSSVVAAVIGSSRDPQDSQQQQRKLIEAGCDVFASNAHAAAEIAGRLEAPCPQ